MKFKSLFISFFLLLVASIYVSANTEKYRIMWRDDPATTMVIGWTQNGGSNPMVYYDTVDHGANYQSYAFQRGVDRTAGEKGMTHNFSRLSNLQPNTAYYFVIRDSDGTSNRFWFKTAPDDNNERLSVIAGGDSRNNWGVRQDANRLVARLRPHFVAFGGDFTDNDNDSQWQAWLNDWQLTIGADGRMIPIVATRGNHEGNNEVLVDIFDIPSTDVYYAMTFGGNLLRTYTLNSEINTTGTQATWLENDLTANEVVLWKMAQYHKPIRPHVFLKSEQNDQYGSWAQSFYNHRVKLVVECDAHTVKTTWPIIPDNGPGSDEGFKRDDANGTVYVGEGCWGAPLRNNDDNKNWTRNSDEFNQFKWIFISKDTIEIRTVKIENVANVGTVNDNDIFATPSDLSIWSPSNGSVVYITHPDLDKPDVCITEPADGNFYAAAQTINIKADASDANGTISNVQFYADGFLIGTDNTAPFEMPWTISSLGTHELYATATDNDNITVRAVSVYISAGYGETTVSVKSSDDDAEEFTSDNSMYLNSTDLELTEDDPGYFQSIGIRFDDLPVPQGATILNSHIQFTVDETDSRATSVSIRGEASDDAFSFEGNSGNISNRPTTNASAAWNNIPAWNSVGVSGADQRTPDLSNVVEEVVGRNGWQEGNALAFILTGSGERTAESFDGSPSDAPKLYIKYDLGPFTMPDLGGDQAICGSGNITLDPGSYSEYVWNDNSTITHPTLLVSNTGEYTVQVKGGTNGNIIAFDTANIIVAQPPALDLGADITTCNDEVLLQSGLGHANYQWSGGQVVPNVLVNTSGTYSVTITSHDGCKATDTIDILLLTPTLVDLGPDQDICLGCNTTLEAGAGFANYLWSDGSTTSSIATSDTGSYWVQVTDANGCVSSDTIQVNCLCPVSVGDIPLNDLNDSNDFRLQVAPNPFSKHTTLSYEITERSKVSMKVIGLNGRQWTLFANETRNAGSYTLPLTAKHLSPGVYFIYIQNESSWSAKRFVVMQ